jgi:ribosome-associated protein
MARRSRPNPPSNDDSETSPTSGSRRDLAPSKSSLKREADGLKQLGVALSELPDGRRKQINMPEDLREAINAYNRMTAFGAKKRQMQYIGKLLRGMEVEPFRQAIDDFAAGRAANAERRHEAERRARRLLDDDEALTEWIADHPDTDVQHLRSLIRAARRDRKEHDPNATNTRGMKALLDFLLQA